MSTLEPGTRLAIGDAVILELAAPAAPCKTIRESFVEGRFARLDSERHPTDGRMYARVIAEGEVRPGDPIVIQPPVDDAAALHVLAVTLDGADASWSRALWRAAQSGGETVHVIADGDLSVSAAPDIPHASFNNALGLVMLPHFVDVAVAHFRRHGVTGWIVSDAPPLADLPVAVHIGVHAIAPEAVSVSPAAGVEIRELAPDEVGPWADIVVTASGLEGGVARAWRAAEAGLARSGHHHRFIATLDGVPAGAASLHTHHAAGWLCAASVLPGARGRGVQRALIAARAERAASLGCEIIGASAVDGGASAENVRRLGFRRVATRNDYRVDPPAT